VTGGDFAAAALQRNAAMMSVVARVIAPRSLYHCRVEKKRRRFTASFDKQCFT
jgi:hypothetical protein